MTTPSSGRSTTRAQSPPPKTYNETMSEGLALLTDLTLSNRTALEEVKQLIYDRYKREDDGRETCDTQRQDLRDTLNRLTAGVSRRLHETEGSRARQEIDQARRLLEEVKALQAERTEDVRRFMEGVQELQDYQTYQAVHAIRQIRAQRQQRR